MPIRLLESSNTMFSRGLLIYALALRSSLKKNVGTILSDGLMNIAARPKNVGVESAEEAMIDRRSLLAKLLGASTILVFPSLPASARDLKDEYMQGTAALSAPDSKGTKEPQYIKLPSGVIYADMREGSGETVREGSRVNLQWVLRKSNGYFVDSSATNDGVPFIFTVGDQTSIAGLDEGIRGMKSNGVRRILIPPSLAYTKGVDEGNPGPLPVGYGPKQQIRRIQTIRKDVPGEYLYLEVQLTRVR